MRTGARLMSNRDRILYTERHLWMTRCPDCGQAGEIDWLDISTWADAGRGEQVVHHGLSWCRTPGCVRQDGFYVADIVPVIAELGVE